MNTVSVGATLLAKSGATLTRPLMRSARWVEDALAFTLALVLLLALPLALPFAPPLAVRAVAVEASGWKPLDRQREVSFALRAYAMFATSADKGAVRDRAMLGE